MFAISKPLLLHPPVTPKLAILALAIMILAGCASNKGAEPAAIPAGTRQNGVLVLTRADNNRTAEVRAGEPVEVRLPENPTTGYTWAIDDTNSQRLALDGTDYTPPVESGFVGARGQRTFRFTARQPGEVALKLKYWRLWEGDASATERFAVNLRILE